MIKDFQKKIGCVADDTDFAADIVAKIKKQYHGIDFSPNRNSDIEILLVLGGDGFMLRTMHQYINSHIKIYGINCGSVGFLLNELDIENLNEKLAIATLTKIHPLEMVTTDKKGNQQTNLAINEISLFRQTNQAAKLKIIIDDVECLKELVCDGILAATPAGSSAYNFSAGGPIIPVGANLIALTPLSAFRPRRWRGALLPHNALVEIEILESDKRSVQAAADFTEIRDVIHVAIRENRYKTIDLLFDPRHSLEKRIFMEQFS
jgi:NAD+ kinase